MRSHLSGAPIAETKSERKLNEGMKASYDVIKSRKSSKKRPRRKSAVEMYKINAIYSSRRTQSTNCGCLFWWKNVQVCEISCANGEDNPSDYHWDSHSCRLLHISWSNIREENIAFDARVSITFQWSAAFLFFLTCNWWNNFEIVSNGQYPVFLGHTFRWTESFIAFIFSKSTTWTMLKTQPANLTEIS